MLKKILLSAAYRLKVPGRLVYRDDFAVVPAPLQPRWPQMQFVRRFLQSLSADCVIDVGANVGQYGSSLRQIGYKGLILSFEPDPACFEQLSKAARSDPQWHVFNSALGSERATANLNIMKSSDFNSFKRPTTQATDLYSNSNVVVETLTVPVERLDSVLPGIKNRLGFQRPYLKMDTQGFDLEVFRGASGVHTDLVGMQSELSVKKIYADVPHWTEALKEYEASGFELSNIFHVNPSSLDLVELDCYMVRKGEASTA